MEISQPSVLTRLPHTGGNNGRSLFTQVLGVRNGVKRKRQEVCAVIDGNSVSIYEAQYGRTISSVPVPPETTFECTPCSLRLRTDSATIRSTYCVTKRRNELHLQCFSDTISKEEAKQHLSSAKLAQDRGKIIQVDYLCWNDTAGVLVLWDSGYYNLLTPDLLTQLSEGKLALSDKGGKLLTSYCASISDASKSMLKARPDLTAGARADTIVVAAVSYNLSKGNDSRESLKYCLWMLPAANISAASEMHLIPTLSHILQVSSNFELRDRDGAMFLSKGTRLALQSRTMTASFELASIVPQKLSESPPLVPDHVSSLLISDYLSLFSSSGGLHIYNTQFRSVQASLDLSKGSLKRRRGDPQTGPVMFIAYFPQLNRVIASRRGNLVAVDLHMLNSNDASTAMKQSSMLINNIGKGLFSHSIHSNPQVKNTTLGNISIPGTFADNWSSVSKRLEECLSKQDIDGFEETLLDHISVLNYSESTTDELRGLDCESTYALSKIFQSASSTEESVADETCTLTVVLPAKQLIRWLSAAGYLTTTRITKALSAACKVELSRPLKADSIVQALFNFDLSLSVVKHFISEAPYIDVQNLCTAIKTLIRKALIMSGSSTVSALEASRDGNDDKSLIKTPEDASSGHASAAEVSRILVTCLERLSSYDSQVISANLRSNLEQQDLIALVQFLRQQLFQSGYTRSLQSQMYPSPPPSIDGVLKDADTTNNAGLDLSLDAILSIISCCIDVIGPLGLVNTGGEMQFVQALIPELSSEITRTLEALEDANYLQGLLRETLRYSTSVGNHSQKKDESGKSSSNSTRTITTLYAEPSIEKGASDASALPLSLHAEKLSEFKVRKGGGQVSKRSQREMGMLQDRLRGPYAVERLIL